VNFFYFVAEEVRSLLADWLSALSEVIGRADLLKVREAVELTKRNPLTSIASPSCLMLGESRVAAMRWFHSNGVVWMTNYWMIQKFKRLLATLPV